MRDRAQVLEGACGDRTAKSVRTRRTMHREGARIDRPTSSGLLERSSHRGLKRNSDGQRKEIDEALGVFGVVTSHAEAGKTSAIQRIRRFPRRGVHVALEERKPDG